MIVMDLEWNRGYDAKPVDEILQIGAVRVDGSGAIRDTFSVFIKPAIHKKFDRGARSLPDLESSRESDVTFPEAWGMFEAWRGDDDEFAFWGSGDFEAVRQNCAYYGLSFTEPAQVFDFQAAFSHALGEDRQQSALWRVVEYLGIPDTFTFHNALNDSVYTALVGMWLGDGARYLKPAPEKPGSRRDKFCSEVFPVTRGRRIGPFVSLEACLDSKAARISPCPICERTTWARQWHSTDGTRFYATSSCPDHGKFIIRLTFDPKSRCARAAVPAIDASAIYEYRRISKRGETHVCASLKGSGQKRRYRARKTPAKG